MSRTAAPLLVALAAGAASGLGACGGASLEALAPDVAAPSGGVPPVRAFSPDVPAWRGGCFLAGPPGKIVNGSPSDDVRLFGAACADPPGPGGLVFLDRFDPVAGGGDVSVLSAAPGSAPVVVARNGGSGAAAPGSTGVRFDGPARRLLALAEVGYVTGTLLVAELPAGAPVRTIASAVRAENYDFVAGDGVLYVGNYDPASREGDLFHWDGTSSQLLAARASRYDFLMYRLTPARDRVAYLRGWKAATGGDLHVQPLPPDPGAAAPAALATGVLAMDWTADGQRLAYRTVSPDGGGDRLWVWDGATAPLLVAADVHAADLVGDDLLVSTGWSVLSPRVTYQLLPAAGGAPRWDLGPAAVDHAVARPDGASGVLVAARLAATGDASTGDLVAVALDASAPVALDAAVSPAAGFRLSPGAAYVAYARDFSQPRAPGSASPQPGLARELRVVPTAGGTPFVLAGSAPAWVAWHPAEAAIAGLDAFVPAANAGRLVARDLPAGEARLTVDAVGLGQFGFADDGSALWALRGWDDGLQRGELVLAATGGPGAWPIAAVDVDVTGVPAARGGRALYCVRGGARDGLWVAALP